MNLYWTGARGSDIDFTGDIFKGSITIYGNNKDSNVSYCNQKNIRVNHNLYCDKASDFILSQQLELINKDPECLFMSYNPNNVYGAPEEVLKRTICLNDEKLMKTLDNKISFRALISQLVTTPEYIVLKGQDIVTNSAIMSELSHDNILVIQSPNSSGGEKTFCVNKQNFHEISCKFSSDGNYMISRYIDNNVPINAHCIIYDDHIVVCPPSVQIITKFQNRLLYSGADFIAYNDLPEKCKNKFIEQLETVCGELRTLGYRGVIGFDALATQDNVYVLEANNRFQGSTFPLNYALNEANLPSVQKLNMEAFNLIERTVLPNGFLNTKIAYSYYTFTNDGSFHSKYISEIINCVPNCLRSSDDGFKNAPKTEEGAYLFHSLFNTNISCVNPLTHSIDIHPAFFPSYIAANTSEESKIDISKLKISLINQGVVISDHAKDYIARNHNFKCDDNFSLDLKLNLTTFVNCPLSIKFVELSPFSLNCDTNNGLFLSFYNKKLPIDVDFCEKPILAEQKTKYGVNTSDIAFFATDRLRLQNSPTCVFNNNHLACKFCEVYDWDLNFGENDILETIDYCFSTDPLPFRHVLIGGRSHPLGSGKETILRMCDRIKKHADVPIYLMCLPPSNLNDINDYYNAGVTEFGFNIEIFNRELAQKIMPGKGRIPLSQYLIALEHASKLVKDKGEARSAFVVGLEAEESLYEGIEAVCKTGATPILSAFRPIPGTPMGSLLPLSSDLLYNITLQCERIAHKYKISLGPSCIACQNNTLNIF